MTKPFEFDGRQYTFQRSGNEYIIWQDDGLRAWDVCQTYVSVPNASLSAPGMTEYQRNYHAYTPAFATVEECKQALRGERPSTYYHRLVFAASAYQAARIAKEEDHA